MALFTIEDLSDTRVADYVNLTDRQLRSTVESKYSCMICESALVIEVALKVGLTPLSFFVEKKRLSSIAKFLDKLTAEVPIYMADPELMSAVCGYRVTRGILACFLRPKPTAVTDALAGATRIAVLENIVDVTNVGAIFRSAAALGADAILLAPNCADPLNRRSLRVSMGTVLQIPWARSPAPWPAASFDLLHQGGFRSAAMALTSNAVPLDDPLLSSIKRLALFFGTEGDGLSHEALSGCDLTVTIPMHHAVDSLNVAAASAVAFWQLCARKRS
jgi:tRNA G18 (ribose-2'-O)-methylase SpoU